MNDTRRILPIIFNTEMARAVLEDRKTETRRLVKPQPQMWRFGDTEALAWVPPAIIKGYLAVGVEYTNYLVPPYRPGDVLWVRETWMEYCGAEDYIFRVDADDSSLGALKLSGFKWRPSSNMPKAAARTFLSVTDVRVERLQEITGGDCLKEGIRLHRGEPEGVEMLRSKFSAGWDSTVKPADRAQYGWAANPWVWVICFKKCARPEGWPG